MGKKNKVDENVQELKPKRRKQANESVEISKGVDIANKAVEKDKKARKERTEKTTSQKKEKDMRGILKYTLIIIVGILVVLLFKYRHIIGITFAKQITEKDAIVVELATAENEVYSYQSELLVFSKGTLTTYSKYGKKTWDYTFDETFIPEINVSGKYIQVINKDSGYIYVFDNKYESCRKKIDGTIKLANINERGQSIIHYAKEGIKSDIGIFDKKGKGLYEITLKTDQIADILLSKNGRYLLMYEVETEGVSVNSVLKMVDLKKSEGVKTLLRVENDIIYDIDLDNSKACVLTSGKVYSLNIAKQSKRDIGITDRSISNIAIDKTGIAFVYKEISDESNTIEVLNNRFSKVGSNKINGSIKDFEYYNSLAYIVQNKDINIYNRWGMHIKEYESYSIINDVVLFNKGKNIAAIYSNKIVIIGI